MGFRITTNMMMNSYRYNLQGSTNLLAKARDMVLTQRNYNSYDEDPASATMEFRLRRTLYQTHSQLNNTKNAYSKYNTAWNNLTEIKNKLIDKTAIEAAIRGDNGATGEARRSLAITLRETAESLIHALNQKLGDQFIFAGNDGLNVPFSWIGNDLYYRGINVNSGGLAKKPLAKEPEEWLKKLEEDASNKLKAYENWIETNKVEKPGAKELAVPDWLTEFGEDAFERSVSASEPDRSEGDVDVQWYKYFSHWTDTPPASDDPTDTKTDLQRAKDRLDKYLLEKGTDSSTLTGADKAWYDYCVREPGAERPTPIEPDGLNWIKDFAEAQVTAAGGQWSDDENNEVWCAYLSGESDKVPESDPPDWVDELLKMDENDSNIYLEDDITEKADIRKEWLAYYKNRYEHVDVYNEMMEGQRLQGWYDYYTHKTNVPPEDTEGKAEELLKKYVEEANVEWDKLDKNDTGWRDYYLHKTNEPPAAEESNWLEDFVMDQLRREFGMNAENEFEGNNKVWCDFLSGKSNVPPENGTRPDWVNDLMKLSENSSYLKSKVENDDDDEGENSKFALDKAKQEWLEVYKDRDNYMKLREMGVEVQYLDLGMGLAEYSPNHPINGSYFNSALCGIAFTGFGVDEDGDSLNLAVLMKELADVFQAWDESMEPQGYNPDLAGPSAVNPLTGEKLTSAELEDKAFRLLDKLQAAKNNFVEEWVELDAKSVFLTSNQERLETLFVDTNTQVLDVSQVDLADAITTFSWQQYCYNAALKIGNQLLSQSLIDYMG